MLNTTDWFHVVAVYDGSTKNAKVYVNGEQAASVTETDTDWTSTGYDFQIGNSPGESYNFNGDIDESRVYDRVLSPGEVRDLYEYAPGPVGYWTFDEGENTTAYDSSGNGNDGTLTNGPTWTNGPVGGAIDLDGSDDYVNVGTGSGLSFTDNFTLSSWIHPTDYHTTGYFGLKNHIFSRGPASTYNYALQATSATTLSFIKRTDSESLQFYNFTGIPSLTDR